MSALFSIEVAQAAILLGIRNLEMLAGAKLADKNCLHIVVLDPAKPFGVASCLPDAILVEQSVNLDSWPADAQYGRAARGKAELAWKHRMDSHAVQLNPHLLELGDCVYGGAVWVNGLVVACSGVQWFYDQLLAKMIAETAITFAYHRRQLIAQTDAKSACGPFLPQEIPLFALPQF